MVAEASGELALVAEYALALNMRFTLVASAAFRYAEDANVDAKRASWDAKAAK
jgi:hypothetical protein